MPYASLREKISAEKAARVARYSEFEKLWKRAHAAGIAAGVAARPVPMTVLQDGAPLETIDDGACGFAWVTVHPGNCSFARWAAITHGATKAYTGGMQVKWVSEFGQSEARKHAYAVAFAQVLRDAGITAYAGSRLD